MIRTCLVVFVLGLLGLFGYFIVTAPGDQSGAERAKGAALQVGDVVVDQGVAGLVHARLTASLGLETARFLHVHADDGRVLIYGLLPPSVSSEDLAERARSVPGVKRVDVQVLPRPGYLDTTLTPEGDPSGSGG